MNCSTSHHIKNFLLQCYSVFQSKYLFRYLLSMSSKRFLMPKCSGYSLQILYGTVRLPYTRDSMECSATGSFSRPLQWLDPWTHHQKLQLVHHQGIHLESLQHHQVEHRQRPGTVWSRSACTPSPVPSACVQTRPSQPSVITPACIINERSRQRQ